MHFGLRVWGNLHVRGVRLPDVRCTIFVVIDDGKIFVMNAARI
jgi:hypothetical protein